MIISLVISIILGVAVAGLTGISFLFWIVSVFVFICSLPFTLVDNYIQSKIDYIQDRDDYRETMREISEDERLDNYLDALSDIDNEPGIYVDNRQIHIYNNYSKSKKRG